MLLIAHGADLEVGIETEKERAARGMLNMLSRVKHSREEKAILSAEVPKTNQATQAQLARM